jgi:gamma-glutamyltranspeptidase/glutathione hydrolase
VPLERLFEDAIWYGREGFPLSGNQFRTVEQKRDELAAVSGFADLYLPDNVEGANFRNARLSATLSDLAKNGLDGFYRGALAEKIAADLKSAGSPITRDDLAAHQAQIVAPLSVKLSSGMVYNMPPPTQGVASLMILGLFDRLGVTEADGFHHIHGLVEAAKQAFILRDAHICDPDCMTADPADWLTEGFLLTAANCIDATRALPWPQTGAPGGDTVWMGAIDGDGRAVSYIQSIYWEFGSGVVLGETGISWQNRGSSFSLKDGARNRLAPRRMPFHTLNPALALLADGRTMAYGTMGGEGQPQTQSAIFTRHVMFGQDLQQAITAPRWLLGRTWGDETMTLKLESRFDAELIAALQDAGHNTEIVEPFSDLMGHAGAVLRHADGALEGATDPRSDGGVAGF